MVSKTEINWIKEKISGIAYGEKTVSGVRPNVSKKNLIKNNKLFVKRLPNYKITDHVKNEKTIYFYGNGKCKSEETLVMIDIDINKNNKKGSIKGAIDFVNLLKKEYFPNLYFESSTNGEGIHGYFILKKLSFSANYVNKTLKNFENWIKNIAKSSKADIEDVEIKGLCPEINYHNNKISNIKYGTLAKLPRNIQTFYKENNQYLSIQEIEKQYSCFKINKNKNIGSVSNKLFQKEDLKNLPEYKNIFNKLTNNCKLKARNHVVTDDDFSIALLILFFIKNNPNSDGSIPTERVKQLWKSLYHYHDVNRNWNHHRWKTIRDFLSLNGYINWKDNNYSFGDKKSKKKGIACKWELSQKFLLYVQNALSRRETKKRASLMDSIKIINIKIKENTRYLVPILKCLTTINYENALIKFYSSMEVLCSV